MSQMIPIRATGGWLSARLARGLPSPRPSLHREPVTAKFDPEDPESLEKAVRYSREKERLWLISTAYGLGFGVLAVMSGLPTALSRAIERRAHPRLRVPLWVAGWSLFEWVCSLPLSYYSGYTVEKRYGLTNQSPRGWLADALKALGVGLALNTPLTTGFLWTVRRAPNRWWLIVSLVALPFTVLLAGLYPVLIAPLFNKYESVGDEALEKRVRDLAEREGVRVSRVLRMDMSRQTNKANAFFAGIGRTKRIVLADTLLDKFEPEEVEVVVAHELAHQVHRDNWKLVGLAGAATFGGTFGLKRLYPLVARRVRAPRLGEPASLPLVGLLASVFGLVAMPAGNAFVRSLERAADMYAVRVTGKPRAFIGAMRQLQRSNLADPDPPAWVRTLLHSHPTLGERIRWGETQAADADGR